MTEEMIILDTPGQIEMYRLIILRGALKLEREGIKMSRGRSAYSIIKQEFGFKGNRERVYTQFCEYVEKMKGQLL